MFYALATQGGQFYTGRAGQDFVGSDAFLYTVKEAAERKAAGFNKFSGLHRFTFTVVPYPDAYELMK